MSIRGCQVTVRVLKGDHLVAKDKAHLMAKASSSDPYVIASELRTETEFGKTTVKSKTLNPDWTSNQGEATFVYSDNVGGSYDERKIIRLSLFDEDKLSTDDSMGKVDVPIKDLVDEAIIKYMGKNASKFPEHNTEICNVRPKGKPGDSYEVEPVEAGDRVSGFLDVEFDVKLSVDGEPNLSVSPAHFLKIFDSKIRFTTNTVFRAPGLWINTENVSGQKKDNVFYRNGDGGKEGPVSWRDNGCWASTHLGPVATEKNLEWICKQPYEKALEGFNENIHEAFARLTLSS